MTWTWPKALKMLIEPFVPSCTLTALGWESESLQLRLLAFGCGEPVGYTVRKEAAVPPVAVTFNATAVASAGTWAASESVSVAFGPRLDDWRVSSTRLGAVATKADGLLLAARATSTPLPAKTMAATAAMRIDQRVRRDTDFITISHPMVSGSTRRNGRKPTMRSKRSSPIKALFVLAWRLAWWRISRSGHPR